MKYKFRLSYKDNEEFIPIDLGKLQCLKDLDVTEIKTIDNFTTSFKSYGEILEFLKRNKLINDSVQELFITIDSKENGKVVQKPYNYSDNIFTERDRNRLNYSYVYGYILGNIKDGELNDIINHYQNLYTHKKFWFIERMSYIIKEDGPYSLNNAEYNEYYDKLKEFINFVFYKKTKDKKTIYYKNIRDFICLLDKIKNIKLENGDYKEYDKYSLVEEYDDLKEGIRDGNDYIPPVKKSR